jgi:hypothetical protein
MVALIFFVLNLAASLFKPRSRLEAENAALRHLIVLQRKVRGRVKFTNSDRLFFIQLYRWFPSILKAMMIIRPETVVRWHRAGRPSDFAVLTLTASSYLVGACTGRSAGFSPLRMRPV